MKKLNYTNELHTLWTTNHALLTSSINFFQDENKKKNHEYNLMKDSLLLRRSLQTCPPLLECLYFGPHHCRQRSHLPAVIWIPHVTVPVHLPVTTTHVMKLQTLVMKTASMASSSFSWALQTRGRFLNCLRQHWLAHVHSWFLLGRHKPANLANPLHEVFLTKNNLKKKEFVFWFARAYCFLSSLVD